MKVKRVIVYILAVLSLTACAPVPAGEKVEVNGSTYYREEDKYYFRDSIWGMKPKDIVILEGREPDDISGEAILVMTYEDVEVNGMKATAHYWIKNSKDRLYIGSYDFQIEHDGRYLYYYDFLAIGEDLTGLYGEPNEKKETVPEEYKDKELAESRKDLPAGKLECTYTWDSEKTQILLVIAGVPGNKAEITLYYTDLSRVDTAKTVSYSEGKANQEGDDEQEEAERLNRKDEESGL